MLRRAPVARPRWNEAARPPKRPDDPVPVEPSARCPERRRLPCPVGRESLPRRAGDGCARKRFRCGDAPIRRSGPPRHRLCCAVGCRSSRRCCMKLPGNAVAEAPTLRWAIKLPPGIGSTPDGRSRGPGRMPEGVCPGVPLPKPRSLLCAAPAPTEVGRRPSLSKPHGAADLKALLR
jgi:hypothetical protein